MQYKTSLYFSFNLSVKKLIFLQSLSYLSFGKCLENSLEVSSFFISLYIYREHCCSHSISLNEFLLVEIPGTKHLDLPGDST